jgi:hypothetical protein
VKSLYHFCAMRQGIAAGTMEYFDGVISTTTPIENAERYQAVKEHIAREAGWQLKGTTVLALELLT